MTYAWSKTAASNATADSAINLREGMAPSALNDAVRGVMAGVAKMRDDLSGMLNTAGTSTAYTLTTNQAFSALADGLTFAARIDETSGLDPTINVDGLGAKNILSAFGTALPIGALVGGSIYTFTYLAAAAKWLVHGPTAGPPAGLTDPGADRIPFWDESADAMAWLTPGSGLTVTGTTITADGFPSGTAMLFQQTAAPTGWTKQTTHNDKALRVVSGTASSGGTVDFSTLFARTTTDSYTLLIADIPAHTHSYTTPSGSLGGPGGGGAYVSSSAGTTGSAGGGGGHSHNIDMRVKYVDLIIATKD